MLTGAVALKEDDLQFISNESGDVPSDNRNGLGLYFHDTRFLNRFELFVNGARPVFLSNSANKHYIATFQAINPPFVMADGQRVKQQTVSIRRSRFVSESGLYERIGFLNCNHFPVQLDVVLALDADFQDIFAIRGFKTQRVAGEISIAFGGEDVVFSYQGRDNVKRTTECTFSRTPEAISAREVRFIVNLESQQFESIVVRVQPCIDKGPESELPDFDAELETLAASYKDWDLASTRISTDNELFDRELLRASRYDIRTLLEKTPQGLVPDAGVPWYAVPFGRDAIITALQTLMYNSSIAEGTLRFLAAYQGTKVDTDREEEPGKIMHEVRRGELARLKEVPHTPYYGTIDATPLFLILFVETMMWTDSQQLYDDLMPAVERALHWIDEYGDFDGDGYVEYVAHRPGGVMNQGWKDSVNAVQYEDGGNARQPIALVEVQGYVYQAKIGLAACFRERGRLADADKLEHEASELRRRFNEDFWMPGEEYLAQALDGDKRQITSVTSNAGHCLWSGICDPDKAQAVVRRLLEPDMFSGWGIRTLSSRSPNYNPMSYHNGSVWPHDTAIIAMGLRRVGHTAGATLLVKSMIEAGFRFSDARLPELFCGFGRDQRFNSSPAAYVVSCSPQAWAAGCVFMLLHCLLDLRPNLAGDMIRVDPVLPDLFQTVRIENLCLRGERIALSVRRDESDKGASVELEAAGSLRLVVVPQN
ncbi:MAG: glycogen debranching N-terminal domain-containing protein [Chloroflexota bacterium]